MKRRSLLQLVAGVFGASAALGSSGAIAPRVFAKTPQDRDALMICGTMLLSPRELKYTENADVLIRAKARNLAASFEDIMREEAKKRGWL